MKLKNLGLSLLTAGIFASGSMPANAQDLEKKAKGDSIVQCYNGYEVRNNIENTLKRVFFHKRPEGDVKIVYNFDWDENGNLVNKNLKRDEGINGVYELLDSVLYYYEENKLTKRISITDTDGDKKKNENGKWIYDDLERLKKIVLIKYNSQGDSVSQKTVNYSFYGDREDFKNIIRVFEKRDSSEKLVPYKKIESFYDSLGEISKKNILLKNNEGVYELETQINFSQGLDLRNNFIQNIDSLTDNSKNIFYKSGDKELKILR